MKKNEQPEFALPKLFTIQQVAAHTQFSTKQVKRWIDEGLLKAVKIGRHWRIAENDLAWFLSTYKKS
jgi:excisionase family DNA binding protein